MYDPQPQPIYELCKQPWQEVSSAVVNLWKAKDKLIPSQPDLIKRMYEYIEIIYQATISTDKTLSEEYDRQIIKFLNIDLINKFIQDPQAKEERDALSWQLVFICAALHSLELTPYDQAELKSIVQDNFNDYDDIIFAHSLRELINKQENNIYAFLFLPWLYNEISNKQLSLYTWEEAILFALILDIVWLGFINFSDRNKQFLLQNYFYLGIVCGVPVRQMLKMTIIRWGSLEYKQKYHLLLKYLNKSNEMVPINLSTRLLKPLADITNSYLGLVQGDFSGFKQEEFLAELYKNQPDRDLYIPWAREAINIFSHLKNFSLIQ